MKCPKCGYLGFETSDRCRNCGYDFSLAVEVAPASELPLRSTEGAGSPLEDFDLGEVDNMMPADSAAALDLDRIIGEDTAGDTGAAGAPVTPPASVTPAAPAPAAPVPPATPRSSLPLFVAGDDDAPMITTPRPPRPPLSVRRTTPEIPRGRTRSVTPRLEEGELAFPTETAEDAPVEIASDGLHEAAAPSTTTTSVAASARLGAALIDAALLAAINAGVVYLTLAMSGLTISDIRVLPILPIAAFFAILDGGYLVGFIAASGQTIGKMVTGIRVLSDDGQRVDISSAVMRAAGCGVSLLTAGIGYLPAFLTTDGRALQDRISRTRVVSAR